jgi:acetyltransferase-like isoleucine patch superfamily enzyme
MNILKLIGRNILQKFYPELGKLAIWDKMYTSYFFDGVISDNVKMYEPYRIYETKIGKYTYIQKNSQISKTIIGKFCSIGPNFLCGFGIHPTDGLSTSPMFYSKCKQNGISISEEDKIEERKDIIIGNDVFIGANVTVLDGVKIGNGAILGAGAIITKDVPPYAIVVGNPQKILRFRFTDDIIVALEKIKWWDFSENELVQVEKHFFKIEDFIIKYT